MSIGISVPPNAEIPLIIIKSHSTLSLGYASFVLDICGRKMVMKNEYWNLRTPQCGDSTHYYKVTFGFMSSVRFVYVYIIKGGDSQIIEYQRGVLCKLLGR